MSENDPDRDEAPPFRDLLRQCEALYRSCAEQYARQRPEIIDDPRAFIDQTVELTTLQPEDVVLEGVPEAAWAGPEAEARQFRLTCPQCGHTSKAAVRHLGRKLACRCGHELIAPWGDLLAP
jgi:hypothetical protein